MRVVPPCAAVTVTCVGALTANVVTAKVALVDPAPTVTAGGTATAEPPLDNAIGSPPAGAALASVTVPTADVPPFTDDGFTVTVERSGACCVMVSVVVRLTPPNTAVIEASLVETTGDVLIANAAAEAPAATVTTPGTLADAELLDSRIAAPPDAAGDESVTIPCAERPPTMAEGLTVRCASANSGGVTVMVAERFVPPNEAVIVTIVGAVTAEVAIAKVADLDPPATAIDAGTDAINWLLEDSTTVAPAGGAAAESVTAPCAGTPAATVDGVMVKPAIGPAGGLMLIDAVRFAPP